MGLREYRRKRHLGATPKPPGGKKPVCRAGGMPHSHVMLTGCDLSRNGSSGRGLQ
jgi:hypothetical protein